MFSHPSTNYLMDFLQVYQDILKPTKGDCSPTKVVCRNNFYSLVMRFSVNKLQLT